jgi:predicted transcriptional regulator
MDEPKSVSDEIDEDAEQHAIEQAEAEIDAGLGVPHERVREWLLKLARGEPGINGPKS